MLMQFTRVVAPQSSFLLLSSILFYEYTILLIVFLMGMRIIFKFVVRRQMLEMMSGKLTAKF